MDASRAEAFQVTIADPVTGRPVGAPVLAPADHTLMQAFLAAGLAWPWSCRNGSCRSCVAQRLAGEVAYTVEWPGLSREERAGGAVLPCVARPCSDLTLAPGWARSP